MAGLAVSSLGQRGSELSFYAGAPSVQVGSFVDAAADGLVMAGVITRRMRPNTPSGLAVP